MDTIRYLPLGDSYTIGTGTSPEAAWPALLTEHLQRDGIEIELIGNPARNGFDAEQVLDHEVPVLEREKPDFATLLIGVNDYVRGASPEVFRQNLATLLDRLLVTLPANRLLVITIPDFGLTPVGKEFSLGRDTHAGIAAFNAIIQDEAGKRGVAVADLFETSEAMKTDLSLVALDGLHPSEAGHASWEEAIYPAAKELLSR